MGVEEERDYFADDLLVRDLADFEVLDGVECGNPGLIQPTLNAHIQKLISTRRQPLLRNFHPLLKPQHLLNIEGTAKKRHNIGRPHLRNTPHKYLLLRPIINPILFQHQIQNIIHCRYILIPLKIVYHQPLYDATHFW